MQTNGTTSKPDDEFEIYKHLGEIQDKILEDEKLTTDYTVPIRPVRKDNGWKHPNFRGGPHSTRIG